MDFGSETLALGLAWYAAFLFSTTCHEAAHAWSALRLGDPTAYEGGQVTLNPLPHVRREIFGTVVVPLLAFVFSGWMIGWASAPYDPAWANRHPRRAAWMSLAGPAANLTLVLLSGVLIRAGMAAGVFFAPDSITVDHVTAAVSEPWGAAATLLSIFFTLNLILFLFNLIPLPPLDGSGVLPLAMSEGAARRYQEAMFGQPGLALLGLVIAWRVFDYVFTPVQLVAINLLYPGMGYG